MQASIGQYSIQAGEPAQPVQQSVVIARIFGFFLRVALPSPCDIGKYFSIIEIIHAPSLIFQENRFTLTWPGKFAQCSKLQVAGQFEEAAQSSSFSLRVRQGNLKVELLTDPLPIFKVSCEGLKDSLEKDKTI
jgi:hypothetical protein